MGILGMDGMIRTYVAVYTNVRLLRMLECCRMSLPPAGMPLQSPNRSSSETYLSLLNQNVKTLDLISLLIPGEVWNQKTRGRNQT